MPQKKYFKKYELPPCPDPFLYILVQMKDKTYYWRKKRGSIKPAKLNPAFQQSAELTKLLSPLTKKITDTIAIKWDHSPLRFLHTNILTALKKYYKEHNAIGYTYLKNLEIQPRFPFHKTFAGNLKTVVTTSSITLEFPVSAHKVKKSNSLLTEFYFEGILISGDISKVEPITLSSEQSELFSFSEPSEKITSMSFEIPVSLPWILLLKIACFEGPQKAAHYKNYAMKIIETGSADSA